MIRVKGIDSRHVTVNHGHLPIHVDRLYGVPWELTEYTCDSVVDVVVVKREKEMMKRNGKKRR